MQYQNPIIRGMNPDPSACRYNEKYYLVTSSFQYFPGVPLYESEDMVNWTPIGHCLTRPSQVELNGVRSSGGIFAPTIRCHNGRFYMVTTNDSFAQNFYVYTDDIHGEWSEPINVDQDGIDPSLYFEGDRTYFISNGSDENGVGSIQMCEIDIDTGAKLTESRILWQGTGGRYLESPHLYKFGSYYYLVESEGGTEYGHMVNYARSENIWGPYESYPGNPVLTNRNLGGYQLQAAGHGDIVEDKNGNWWFIHLAFRQTGQYDTFHHLGRETCLEPLYWQEDGWFTIGEKGTARLTMEVDDSISFAPQNFSYQKTFAQISPDTDWLFLRTPVKENYRFLKDSIEVKGSAVTLDDVDSPSFACFVQDEFDIELTCTITPDNTESGICFYMDEQHHYEIVVDKDHNTFVRQTIGVISQESEKIPSKDSQITVKIVSDAKQYHFYVMVNDKAHFLGDANTRYLSSEVATGFTGVMIGFYAIDSQNKAGWTKFTNLNLTHTEQ